MSIIKITGGLGNQLFQFAFGQYVAKTSKGKVKYELQTNIAMNNFTLRDFGLMNFDLDIDIAEPNDFKGLRFFSNGIFSRIERKLVQIFPIFNKSYFVENKLHRIIPNKDLKKDCYYDGYWQSYNYLEINKEYLRNHICLKRFSVGNEKLIDDMHMFNSVSLHVRRGDYISIKKNSSIYQICNLEYYKAAIHYIERKIPNPKFYVFSDDIEWAKKNFSESKFVFVEDNYPHVDMYLMSLCKNNIIATVVSMIWSCCSMV